MAPEGPPPHYRTRWAAAAGRFWKNFGRNLGDGAHFSTGEATQSWNHGGVFCGWNYMDVLWCVDIDLAESTPFLQKSNMVRWKIQAERMYIMFMGESSNKMGNSTARHGWLPEGNHEIMRMIREFHGGGYVLQIMFTGNSYVVKGPTGSNIYICIYIYMYKYIYV